MTVNSCIHEDSLITTINGPKKIKNITENKILTPDNLFVNVLGLVKCWIKPINEQVHDCIWN